MNKFRIGFFNHISTKIFENNESDLAFFEHMQKKYGAGNVRKIEVKEDNNKKDNQKNKKENTKDL